MAGLCWVFWPEHSPFSAYLFTFLVPILQPRDVPGLFSLCLPLSHLECVLLKGTWDLVYTFKYWKFYLNLQTHVSSKDRRDTVLIHRSVYVEKNPNTWSNFFKYSEVNTLIRFLFSYLLHCPWQAWDASDYLMFSFWWLNSYLWDFVILVLRKLPKTYWT